MLAADPDNIAVHQHNLGTQHVVGRQAVLQAMHAAGVFRNVAADGTRDLAGRIGRIIESSVHNFLGQGQISDARLGDDAAVFKIGF